MPPKKSVAPAKQALASYGSSLAGPSNSAKDQVDSPFPFDYPPLEPSEADAESSSDSDWGTSKGKATKKAARRRGKKRAGAKAVPLLEEVELRGSTPEHGATYAPSTNSTTAQIVLNIPPGALGPVTLNIDLSSLLPTALAHGLTPTLSARPAPLGKVALRFTGPAKHSSKTASAAGQPPQSLFGGGGAAAGTVDDPADQTVHQPIVPMVDASGRKRRATSVVNEANVQKVKMRLERALAPPARSSRVGFCDLPAEIRLRVYRMTFRDRFPVDFGVRDGFRKSSQFLATCHMVFDEGRVILYGENAFHFEKTDAGRGHFYEPHWKPVAWSDVRRFFEGIGPINISLLRFVSFIFADTHPASVGRTIKTDELRYTNEPNLHHVLQMLGHHGTKLYKFAFCFISRLLLESDDVLFIRALRTVKAEHVIHASHDPKQGRPSAVREWVLKDLLQKMQKEAVHDYDINETKKKGLDVITHFDRPRASYFGY